MTRKTKQIIIIVISVVLLLTIVISTTVFFVLTGRDKRYWIPGQQEVTFYSQKTISPEDIQSGEFIGNIDKGFNDYVFEGANEYSRYKNEELKQDSKIGVVSSKGWANGADPIYTGEDQLDSLWWTYRGGAKTIVSSGNNIGESFRDLYSISSFADEAEEKGWGQIIVDDIQTGIEHENAVSITFKEADSGFMAGLAGATYITSITNENPNIPAEATLWGGVPFESVSKWLSGFEQGVNYFNYRVLGYDLQDNPVAQDETYGLWSENKMNPTGRKTGIKLSNGYSDDGILIDYSKDDYKNIDNTIANNSIDTVKPATEDNKNSWYTGGFGSSDDIDSTNNNVISHNSALFAQKRATNAVTNGSTLLFPVAGGQTEIAAKATGNSGNKTSKVIGVDVDATKVDEANSAQYIGSATKNLEAASALGTWYLDRYKNNYNLNYNNAKSEINNTEILGIKASNFISEKGDKSWNISSSVDAKGALFEGTYQNGGVQFVQSGGYMEKAWSKIRTSEMEGTFSQFMQNSYSTQESVGGVENYSLTFTAPSIIIPGEHSVGKWIPDWT